MPEELNLLWFPRQDSFFRAWWHEDGWCLYQNGETHPWPADLSAESSGARRSGFGGEVTYYRFDNPGVGPHHGKGGNIYYDPELGLAVNTKSGQLSVVGVPFTGWPVTGDNDGVHIYGYDVEWLLVPSPAGTVKNFWKPVVTVRADGLGYYFNPTNPDGTRKYPAILPYWSNKLYPEFPPLGRGRPPQRD